MNTHKCGVCGKPVGSLNMVTDFHGNSIGMTGDCCNWRVTEQLDAVARQHGAQIEHGAYLCSPKGTPRITDFKQLRLLSRL